MDKVFFFEFESRQWTSRSCKDVLPQWLFGHATKRGRSVFAVGSPRGETGTLEVPTLLLSLHTSKGTPHTACYRHHLPA